MARSQMTAACIAQALRGRPSGRGWMAQCPAHRDQNPSLSIRESDSRVLLHCFAGRNQEDLIAALRERRLWSERQRRSWTPEERREYGRRRSSAELRAKEIVLWHAAIVRRLEQTKAAAYAADVRDPDRKAERALEDAARRLFFHANLHGAALVEKFGAAI